MSVFECVYDVCAIGLPYGKCVFLACTKTLPKLHFKVELTWKKKAFYTISDLIHIHIVQPFDDICQETTPQKSYSLYSYVKTSHDFFL